MTFREILSVVLLTVCDDSRYVCVCVCERERERERQRRYVKYGTCHIVLISYTH